MWTENNIKMAYYYAYTKMFKIKSIPNIQKNVEVLEHSYTAGRNASTLKVFLQFTIYNLLILLISICPKKRKYIPI